MAQQHPPNKKETWIYVSANLIVGGGDQILLAHARALQHTGRRIVLFSLEPVAAKESLADDLRALGVELRNSRFVDRCLVPALAIVCTLPAILKASIAFLALLGRETVQALTGRALQPAADNSGLPSKPDAGILVRAYLKARTYLKGARARPKAWLRKQMLRTRVSMYRRFHKVAGIHVFHAAACQALGTRAHTLGVPSIYTEISGPLSHSQWVESLKGLLPRFTKLVIPARAIGEQLQQMYSLGNRFEIVPFTVRLTPAVDAMFPRSGRFNYGLIARLSGEKGHRDLLKAAPIIHARCPGARLVFAGDGPMRAELQEMARELGIANAVDFLGAFHPADISRVMAQLDVVVLPSYVEGMPHVLLEAMAFGKPIVATPVGAVPEMVVNGQNGFLVPVGDLQTLAERISQILLDEELRMKMGRRGLELFSKEFDDAAVLNKIRLLYDTTLAEWSRGAQTK